MSDLQMHIRAKRGVSHMEFRVRTALTACFPKHYEQIGWCVDQDDNWKAHGWHCEWRVRLHGHDFERFYYGDDYIDAEQEFIEFGIEFLRDLLGVRVR